ncbi:GIY-YIG nuclease family protein [Mycolicibacterium fortuitum]|uniref:GIY-YIG nuclease family protein n=1 Tax=Mycolicibacterium fortuitum TaxID=1766 RepID=UPI0026052BE4|nr:GIY-YIG nuclease family protein [Mycolicibacterium fortuitum]
MNKSDSEGRACGSARWGVYAFYDFEGEPIYVGQTRERLSGRISRHLTGQRSDAVAKRILDPLEVAEIEVWPLWHLQGVAADDRTSAGDAARAEVDALEYSVWHAAILGSRFGAILNEKRPPTSPLVHPLPASFGGQLYTAAERQERSNPDVRLARRAETVSRLADVVRERSRPSRGLRRVLAVQALRLAYLAATRSAMADGRDLPTTDAFDYVALVGEPEAVAATDQEPDDVDDADEDGSEDTDEN